MAKIVITKRVGKPSRKSGTARSAIKMKRIRSADGKITTLRVLRSESDSFGEDFTRVFGANVKKARSENKRVTGTTDRDPAKR